MYARGCPRFKSRCSPWSGFVSGCIYIHLCTFWLGRSDYGNLRAGVDLSATQLICIYSKILNIRKKKKPLNINSKKFLELKAKNVKNLIVFMLPYRPLFRIEFGPVSLRPVSIFEFLFKKLLEGSIQATGPLYLTLFLPVLLLYRTCKK